MNKEEISEDEIPEDEIHYLPVNPNFFKDALQELKLLNWAMFAFTLFSTLSFVLATYFMANDLWILPFSYFLGSCCGIFNIALLGFSTAFLFNGQAEYAIVGIFCSIITLIVIVSIFAAFMERQATLFFILGTILPIIFGGLLFILLRNIFLKNRGEKSKPTASSLPV